MHHPALIMMYFFFPMYRSKDICLVCVRIITWWILIIMCRNITISLFNKNKKRITISLYYQSAVTSWSTDVQAGFSGFGLWYVNSVAINVICWIIPYNLSNIWIKENIQSLQSNYIYFKNFTKSFFILYNLYMCTISFTY